MIYGVSFDTEAENKAFAEKFDFNYPLLCDTDREMGFAYGATPDKTSGFAKRIGVVIDPEGNIKHYEPSANAKSYPIDVLEKL